MILALDTSGVGTDIKHCPEKELVGKIWIPEHKKTRQVAVE